MGGKGGSRKWESLTFNGDSELRRVQYGHERSDDHGCLSMSVRRRPTRVETQMTRYHTDGTLTENVKTDTSMESFLYRSVSLILFKSLRQNVSLFKFNREFRPFPRAPIYLVVLGILKILLLFIVK